jgi:hypothetical protein
LPIERKAEIQRFTDPISVRERQRSYLNDPDVTVLGTPLSLSATSLTEGNLCSHQGNRKADGAPPFTTVGRRSIGGYEPSFGLQRFFTMMESLGSGLG